MAQDVASAPGPQMREEPALSMPLEQLALMVMQSGLGLSRLDTIAYVRSVVDLIVQLDRQGGQRGIAAIERTSDIFKREFAA